MHKQKHCSQLTINSKQLPANYQCRLEAAGVDMTAGHVPITCPVTTQISGKKSALLPRLEISRKYFITILRWPQMYLSLLKMNTREMQIAAAVAAVN